MSAPACGSTPARWCSRRDRPRQAGRASAWRLSLFHASGAGVASEFDAIGAEADADLLLAFGEAATYRAGGTGPAVAVTVQIDRGTATGDGFGQKLRKPGRILRFRFGEIPAPAKGDTLEIGAETITLAGAPELDMAGLLWTAEG